MKKILIFLLCFLFVSPVMANGLPDFDQDGVPDEDEINIYHTDYKNKDTDGDGFSDWVELNFGYSPHNPKMVKLEDNDFDSDGLSDRMELYFNTNLASKDTDGDGYEDGEEINNFYNPIDGGRVRLEKKIEIDVAKQRLNYFLGGVKMGEFLVSSGVNNSTPKGQYKIINKITKAWSPYGLWMPYWMGLGTGRFGLHELPIWPSGYREGEDHLGTPASHGCIRLGVGPAEFLYNWAEVNTPVNIY